MNDELYGVMGKQTRTFFYSFADSYKSVQIKLI